MTAPGDERCLSALSAALQALLQPTTDAPERALAAYAEPLGLDLAALLEPTPVPAAFAVRALWTQPRAQVRVEDLRLPPRWLEPLAEGRVLRASPGEPAPAELKPLRLSGAPALLVAPARVGSATSALLLASNMPQWTWSMGHEQSAIGLAAALASALRRVGEAAQVLDQLPVRVAWKDTALRYRGCNRAFARASGVPAAQLVGRDDRDAGLRPELGDRGEPARRLEREVLRGGRPQLGRIEAAQLPSGREVWCSVSRVPLLDVEGKIAGLLVATEDLTERVQAAAMLRHAERSAAVSRLAAALAADLRPALADIQAAARDEGPDASARIEAAARVADDLVRQIGALARRQLADPIDIAPAPLIARMQRILARTLGERVALQLPAESLRYAVRADPRQLEQMIVLLVRHVREFLSPGGRLDIEAAPQTLGIDRAFTSGLPAGEYVRLRLLAAASARPGEPPREPAEASAELALAQAIVQHAGGTLRVRRDDVGLALEVLLPRVFSAPKPGEGGPALDLRGVEVVLVIDDDAYLRAAVALVLRQLGYHALAAEDVGEALALQRGAGSPVALALVSAELPGGGPAEALRRLREVQPDLRALVTTRQGYSQGDALVVPCTFEALALRVRQALDGRPV